MQENMDGIIYPLAGNAICLILFLARLLIFAVLYFLNLVVMAGCSLFLEHFLQFQELFKRQVQAGSNFISTTFP